MQPHLTTQAAGDRLFRTTLAVFGPDDRTDAATIAEVAGALGTAHTPRLASVQRLSPTPQSSVLDLQLRSSETVDTADSDLAAHLGMAGDAAATYWTRSANALLEITELAVELLATQLDGHRLATDRLVLRTTPLGDPVNVACLARLAIPDYNVPVVHLNGVSRPVSRRLIPALRDLLDERRWGPAETALPTVGYFAAIPAVTVTYPPTGAGPSVHPLAGDLEDLCFAIAHLGTAIDALGAVRATAVEARLDVRRRSHTLAA